jgi:hypothetical protein
MIFFSEYTLYLVLMDFKVGSTSFTLAMFLDYGGELRNRTLYSIGLDTPSIGVDMQFKDGSSLMYDIYKSNVIVVKKSKIQKSAAVISQLLNTVPEKDRAQAVLSLAETYNTL